MPNPIRDLFFGTTNPKRELVQALSPRRTFADVILPQSTRQALDFALQQIRKRELIFGTWGLGERHATGLGVAFNFAGPPGTGKTACAEAIANALNKRLLVVRYSEMESLWAGETGKNVAAVFTAARDQDAVLFFDEADAIAGKRFSSITQGYQREANTVVNVLLKELEEFDGVVIFATNLAANFDPAFERRVRTHILFEMPGPVERAQIWQVQLHRRTPLADDVDFKALGEKYAVSGGDIKNAVLKAAQMATAEPGPDVEKKIHQRHFETGMQEVVAAKKVMEQSLYSNGEAAGDGSHIASAMAGLNGAWSQLSQNQGTMEGEVAELGERIGDLEQRLAAVPTIIERFDDAARTGLNSFRSEVKGKLDDMAAQLPTLREELRAQSDNLSREVEPLRVQIGELRGQTTKLTGEVEPLRTQIGELRAQTGELRPALDEQRAKLDDLFARIKTMQEENTAQRATLETRLRFWPLGLYVGGGALFVAVIALIAAFVIH